MKSIKCDICGREFGYGFLINVELQGGHDLLNVAQDRFETGNKDICSDCYYKLKETINNRLCDSKNP